MILKDLILKYEFDTIVPDLIEIENPVKDNLYAFKEAFDTLRRMPREMPVASRLLSVWRWRPRKTAP